MVEDEISSTVNRDKEKSNIKIKVIYVCLFFDIGLFLRNNKNIIWIFFLFQKKFFYLLNSEWKMQFFELIVN